MRKIPRDLENPIDNWLIQLADYLSPFFRATGHTPNMITTYSLITGLLSCYCLWKGHVILFALLYALSYFFDCFDGHFARKYKMTSQFGDIYDHVKDVVVVLLILFVVFKKCKKNINAVIITIFVVFTYMSAIHLGCQQKYCTEGEEDKDDSAFLNKLRPLCGNKDNIKWTRFFGTGTYNLVLILLICYVCQTKGCAF